MPFHQWHIPFLSIILEMMGVASVFAVMHHQRLSEVFQRSVTWILCTQWSFQLLSCPVRKEMEDIPAIRNWVPQACLHHQAPVWSSEPRHSTFLTKGLPYAVALLFAWLLLCSKCLYLWLGDFICIQGISSYNYLQTKFISLHQFCWGKFKISFFFYLTTSFGWGLKGSQAVPLTMWWLVVCDVL